MTASQDEISALGLHHSAYRCRDAEETRAFWEDRVGFPLVMALKIDEHPTTGEAVVPFREDDDPDELYKTRWGMDLHFAMRVADHDALARWADRLSAAGVAHEGPIRHGICSSIYFHDPNGYRFEFTAEDDAESREFTEHEGTAHDSLRA